MIFGLFGSLIVSIIGVRLFFDGVRHERPMRMRTLGIPAWMLVLGGLVCQVPLLINLYAHWLQQSG